MEEFKRFKLDESLKKTPEIIEEFKSELGPFSIQQDHLIRIARSKTMIALTFFIIAHFVVSVLIILPLISTNFSYLSAGEETSYNWVKIIFVIDLLIQIIAPIGTVLIVIGGYKKSPDSMAGGMGLIYLLLGIYYVIFWVGVIVAVFLLIKMLTDPFITVVFIMGIISGILFLYYKLIFKSMAFIDETRNVLLSKQKQLGNIPNPEGIRPFLGAFLTLTIFSGAIQLFYQNTPAATTSNYSQLIYVDIVIKFLQLSLTLSILITLLMLITKISNAGMEIIKRTPKKQRKTNFEKDWD